MIEQEFLAAAEMFFVSNTISRSTYWAPGERAVPLGN
jgi:hypothetical protein